MEHQTKTTLRVACLLFVFLAGNGLAQDEAAGLRTHLGVDAGYSVTLDAARTLPAADPLRVFLALGLDLQATRNLETAIAKWNKGDARKHGRIEIVADLTGADVILARFRHTSSVQTATDTRSGVVAGSVWDPALGRMVAAPVAVQSSSSTAIVPTYGYILGARASGASVLYRYTTTTAIDQDKKSGTWLTDALFKMMKTRPKQ